VNVLERVKKLLRLAQNAGSEQEAALAAQRAAQLMAQHEIHEASINLYGPDEVRAVEEIAECHPVTYTRKRVAWHIKIASAVAMSYGAECYTTSGYSEAQGNGIRFFGRLSAVQAAAYTTQYLIRKVEEITDQHAPLPLYARRYRNAFRLGCAARIAARIHEQTQAEKQKFAEQRQHAEHFEATRQGRANREQFDVSDEGGGTTDMTPPASAGVLARVERERAEVHTAYKTYSKKWGRAASIGTVSSGSGFEAGKKAGDRVKLTNQARGGLPRGQGVLK
jgi:hypothetical protein